MAAPTEPEAIPADVLVSIPRDLAERVTEIANRNEQSVEGDKLAVLLSAPRASRAPVDGAGWRPIETAPKDGTVIDLWFLGSGRRTDCVWGEAISGQHPGNQVWLVDGLERNIVKGIPTHWMPLPAAPGTHPAPASPDAEMVKALSGLVKAIGSMGVPQNVADVARLVMVTLGPALSHAQDVLSKHEGDRS